MNIIFPWTCFAKREKGSSIFLAHERYSKSVLVVGQVMGHCDHDDLSLVINLKANKFKTLCSAALLVMRLLLCGHDLNAQSRYSRNMPIYAYLLAVTTMTTNHH